MIKKPGKRASSIFINCTYELESGEVLVMFLAGNSQEFSIDVKSESLNIRVEKSSCSDVRVHIMNHEDLLKTFELSIENLKEIVGIFQQLKLI